MNAGEPEVRVATSSQQVIDAAHAGDYAPIGELFDVMRKPTTNNPAASALPKSGQLGLDKRPGVRCCPAAVKVDS